MVGMNVLFCNPAVVGVVKVVAAVAFSWNSNPHIPGIPAGDELLSVLNKDSLPSSSSACGLPSPTFIGYNSRIELYHTLTTFLWEISLSYKGKWKVVRM